MKRSRNTVFAVLAVSAVLSAASAASAAPTVKTTKAAVWGNSVAVTATTDKLADGCEIWISSDKSFKKNIVKISTKATRRTSKDKAGLYSAYAKAGGMTYDAFYVNPSKSEKYGAAGARWNNSGNAKNAAMVAGFGNGSSTLLAAVKTKTSYSSKASVYVKIRPADGNSFGQFGKTVKATNSSKALKNAESQKFGSGADSAMPPKGSNVPVWKFRSMVSIGTKNGAYLPKVSATAGISYQNGVSKESSLDMVGNEIAGMYSETAPTKALSSAVSITLNKANLSIKKGSSSTLKATVKGASGATWKSSNSAVASVSSAGKVTAKKKGTAVITATTKTGGKKATCKVTVK